jgi:hypothetical protein
VPSGIVTTPPAQDLTRVFAQGVPAYASQFVHTPLRHATFSSEFDRNSNSFLARKIAESVLDRRDQDRFHVEIAKRGRSASSQDVTLYIAERRTAIATR